MPTTRQGMSSAEIEHIVAQRVTNAIEAISIYETKIRVAHDLIVQVVRQGAKIARNANNKRKCGAQRHFKSKCPRLKNQNHCNQKGNNGKARGDPNVVADNANA
ncbi:hypothetical protein Tco_1358925 [Tanacetum coccineum]